MDTDSASFAPVPVYQMFFQFRFCHTLVPGLLFMVRISYIKSKILNIGHRTSNIVYGCWSLVYGLTRNYKLETTNQSLTTFLIQIFASVHQPFYLHYRELFQILYTHFQHFQAWSDFSYRQGVKIFQAASQSGI